MKIHGQVFLCGPMFSIHLHVYLGMELLNHVVTPCLSFWQTARLFSKNICIILPSYLQCVGVPAFPYPHRKVLAPFFFFYYNQPSRHKVVSHHGFNLRFSDGYWGWVFFHVLIGHVHIFFGEMSDWILCTLFTAIFVFLLLISVLCLTIVDDSIIISKWISFF